MLRARALRTFRFKWHLIVVLFVFSMQISKSGQILYLNARGVPEIFAFGYTAMAVAGIGSAYYGRIVDRVGPGVALPAGLGLYSAALGMRVATNAPVLALSGVLAGVSASTVLIAIREWMVRSVDKEEYTYFAGQRSAISRLAVISAGGIAGVTLSLVDDTSPLVVLMACALCAIAAIYTSITRNAITTRHSVEVNRDEDATDSTGSARPDGFLLLLALLAITAFATSILVPYLPLVLVDGGLSSAHAAFAISAVAVLQILAARLRARSERRLRASLELAWLEALAAFASLLVLAFLGVSFLPALLACVAVRGVVEALAGIAYEVAQLEVVSSVGGGAALFGWLQSAYLGGDAAGGATAGFAWGTAGATGVLAVSAVCSAIAGAVAWIYATRTQATNAVAP